jgi:hypothetical protein
MPRAVAVLALAVELWANGCSKGPPGERSAGPAASISPPSSAVKATPAIQARAGGSAVPAPLPLPSRDAGPSLSCGDKPCPLYWWMKQNTARAMNAKDFDALAAALDRVATFAPPPYLNWASIARDGANAARALDIEATRAACRGCHLGYRDAYKREMRDRRID